MALLFIDDEIFQDKEQWGQNKETFVAAINKYIDTHYTGEDSEEVYALFNAEQVNLLQTFFKGFSVEMYRELNGTVDLQIQKRNEKVKAKINKIAEFMGPINLEDWVYDGMVDGGKDNSQKCDLCPRPVRYAHFAVNKKTSECLRFGCNCAADFFNIDKSSLASMRTIQSKTLQDIRKIACVIELNKFNEYYKYLGGHIGKVVLEEGVAGLQELMSFVVQWGKDGNLVSDGDAYPIKFGDGRKVNKSLEWIKEHIVFCLNADLDPDVYLSLEDRIIEKKVLKDDEKAQLNTAGYVRFAIQFVDLGLPIPESLMKKLNSIISKTTKQHHPDYIKYAKELLISHNLAKSSLLQKVFTDFIVNYYSSAVGAEERDPELEYWGVRGAGTFYKTVLQWETAMVKLMHLKDFYSLISQNLITEEEFNKYLRSKVFRELYINSDNIKGFMKRCSQMFLTKKEVIKNPDKTIIKTKGISKYTVKDVDDNIKLCSNTGEKIAKKFNTGYFTPETIPVDIGLHYYAMQQSYRDILNMSLNPTIKFLRHFLELKSVKDSIKYLCALEIDKSSSHAIELNSKIMHGIFNTYFYNPNNIGNSSTAEKDEFKKWLDGYSVEESYYKKMYTKYKDVIPQFRKDAQELYDILIDIYENLKKPIVALPAGKKLTVSNINSDYEDLVVNKENTNKDYFKEYCNLLVGKRGTKTVQYNLYQRNLNTLLIYKQFDKYKEMLKDIQKSYEDNMKNVEEAKLYGALHLDDLKFNLSICLDVNNMKDFIKFIAFREYTEVLLSDYSYSTKKSEVLGIKNNIGRYLEGSLKNSELLNLIDNIVPKNILEECYVNKELFKALYEKYKELFIALKSCKAVLSFEKYYELLEDSDSKIDRLLESKECISCNSFIYDIKNMILNTGKYRASVSPKYEDDNTHILFWKMGKHLEIYKGILEVSKPIADLVKQEYSKQKEDALKQQENERLKSPLIRNINVCLQEHLDFFDVDVDKVRHKYRQGMRDVAIRQKEAFNVVQYQDSLAESLRFVKALKELGQDKWSDGVEEVILDLDKVSSFDNSKIKACCEALKAEMYNQSLVFNHFDLTQKVLKALKGIDLYKLDVSELQELKAILEKYYIFRSQVDYINCIIDKYSENKDYNYKDELLRLPKPVKKDIKEFYDKFTEKPDSTGYTGTQKAEQVYTHPQFETLDLFLKKIVKTVYLKKFCSQKQLVYVNKAFETLGLGEPDVVEEEKESNNDGLEGVKLAQALIDHPNFNTLPTLIQDIANTVVKTNRCSSKQKYYLDKGKESINID